MKFVKRALKEGRLAPTLVPIAVALLASWMATIDGGYFVGDWALVALVVALVAFAASVSGLMRTGRDWWSTTTTVTFALYTVWTSLSLLWAPNRGDAWQGAGLTVLYLLVFCVVVGFVTMGASRRWILAASAIGPSVVAAFTLLTMASGTEDLFENDRLMGTVGYYNGEAAFLLVSFWAAIYVAGSRRVTPALRSVVLGGAVLSVAVAALTQSRGAMVALAASAVVFFLFSGQRLRGLVALAPVTAALYFVFPGLNGVYLAFLEGGDPSAALGRVVPTVWLAAAGAAVYGLLWGLLDNRWRPPTTVVRVAGGFVLALCAMIVVFAASLFVERVGDPVAWGDQTWEAFTTNDVAGQEQSRYLSASGSGRYTLWQVAHKDFVSHPVLGVGTHNYEATYYRLREQPAGFVRQPHMLPLEVLSERGMIGGVLFFGFLATCLTAGLWQRFRRLSAEGKGQVGAATAAVSYWLVHSSAEWLWQLPAVTLPAMVYLAMLVAPWRRTPEAPARWPLRTAGAVFALAAVVAIAPLYVADSYLRQSRATENPWVALQAVERAQTMNPVDPSLPQREAELALKIGDWPRVEDAYREAIRLNPEHYESYYLLALFLEQRGEQREALALYRNASRLNPLEPEIGERLGRLEAEVAEREREARGAGKVD